MNCKKRFYRAIAALVVFFVVTAEPNFKLSQTTYQSSFLEILYPKEGQLVLENEIDLRGKVEKEKVHELFLELNNQKIQKIFFGETGTFSERINLFQKGHQRINLLVFLNDGEKIEVVQRNFFFGMLANFHIGNRFFKLNDNLFGFEKAPRIEESRTLVPIHFVESLPVVEKVDISPIKNSFSVHSLDKKVYLVFEMNKKEAYVNAKRMSIDVAPRIENGTIMVPIRFVAEQLGSKVGWEPHQKEVLIEYPK